MPHGSATVHYEEPVVTEVDVRGIERLPVCELDPAGLVAPEEHAHCAPRHAPTHRRRHRMLVWPSYAGCLADAPGARNHEGKDRSAADFNFCLISIDRGWSVEAAANQLMAESEKARSTGYSYALFTAKEAASVVSSDRR